MTLQQPERSNSKPVAELFTEATIEVLNEVLMQRGIAADMIISILPVPGQTLVKPTPPQFRVLYRTG